MLQQTLTTELIPADAIAKITQAMHTITVVVITVARVTHCAGNNCAHHVDRDYRRVKVSKQLDDAEQTFVISFAISSITYNHF